MGSVSEPSITPISIKDKFLHVIGGVRGSRAHGRGLGEGGVVGDGVSLGDLGSVIIQLFKLWLVLCKINNLNCLKGIQNHHT